MKQFSMMILMLCFAFCTTIYAQERAPIKNVEVTASELTARTGGAKEFRSLGTFKRGDILPVYSTNGEWYETKCPAGLKVYVFQKYITVNGNDGVITGENVNGRSDASEDSQVLFKFPAKTNVNVLGVKDGWVLIAPPPQATSWVAKQYTKDSANNQVVIVDGNNKKPIRNSVDEDEFPQPKTTPKDSTKPVVTKGNNPPPVNNELNKLLEEQNKKKESIKQETEARQRAILAGEKEDQFLKTGWVRRLGQVIGRKATHALFLSQGTDICHLISNSDAIKIEDYAGKYVGIKGDDIGKEKRSDVPLIQVTSIVILDDNPSKIRLQDKAKSEPTSQKEDVIDSPEDK